MTNNDLSMDAKTALEIVCLFLAQQGEPFKELGYKNFVSAYTEIGKIFNRKANSVKNIKDTFDRFTDSKRKGWKPKSGDTIAKNQKKTFENYSDKSFEELSSLSKQILGENWTNFITFKTLFERVALDQSSEVQVKVPHDNITVEFSSKTPKWFVITIEQIISVLDDLMINQKNILKQAKGTKNKKGLILNVPKTNMILYNENFWREKVNPTISNLVAKNLTHTQPKVTFELLSKIIHFSGSQFERKEELNLEINALHLAKNTLQNIQSPLGIISDLTGGENRIFYGAPGTGKSHEINKIISGKIYTRTVFHPDLQNSDFFGCLKPRMEESKVNYEFVPGPFMKALSEAYLNYSDPVYLVIEELNRAPASAVFGDLFLLLDRNDDGQGEYDVDFPSPESLKWFNYETGMTCEKILIPSNLYIYASVNSADQGVYPIDTAFRRRWQQEYLPLDYKKGPVGKVSYVDKNNNRRTIKWQFFVEALNNFLTSIEDQSIAEDRLIGQWFVKVKELDGKGIPEKILLYLWDDLLRHEGREKIFDLDKIKTYGDLAKAVENQKHFLSTAFTEHLNKNPDTNAEI